MPILRSCRLFFTLLCLLSLAGCVSTAPVKERPTSERPALDTDEAGLWMITDKAEKALVSSGKVVNDKAVNSRLRSILCRLSPRHCDGVRIYVVRTPDFNAAMAPNGFMQVQTGLLLRAANEDQLAFVLAHELTHYLDRHTLAYWRELRKTAGGAALVQVLTSAAGVGLVGSVATLAAYGGVSAFSRDQELEADRGAYRMMESAGYNTKEAVNVWEALIEERDASNNPESLSFFSTHPATTDRIEVLKKIVMQNADTAEIPSQPRSEYNQLLGNNRIEWFRDELRIKDYGRTQVLLSHLAGFGMEKTDIDYLSGELFRLRDNEGDVERAIGAYSDSAQDEDAPAEVWLQLGLLYRRIQKPEQSKQALRRYLELKPDANDRRMVEYYINEV